MPRRSDGHHQAVLGGALDEEGKTIKKREDDDMEKDESVVMVENRVAPAPPAGRGRPGESRRRPGPREVVGE